MAKQDSCFAIFLSPHQSIHLIFLFVNRDAEFFLTEEKNAKIKFLMFSERPK